VGFVDDENLVFEVDTESFSSILLKKQVIWQGDKLRKWSDGCSHVLKDITYLSLRYRRTGAEIRARSRDATQIS
jgi:hypothetical protein